MNASRRKAMLVTLTLILTVALCSAGALTAMALTTDDTVAYPFRTGNSAYANAPTWTGATEMASADTWQFLQINFKSTDFTDVDYVALQIKAPTGNPGVTFGLLNGGNRYGTYSDKTSGAYFVSENRNVRSIDLINGGYVYAGSGADGMLLVPMDSMSWISWSDAQNRTLSSITSIFIETNAKFNWDFSFIFGEVGIYKGDPSTDGTFTKLFDLTAGEKKNSYYNGLPIVNPLTFPSDVPVPEPVLPDSIAYPFRTNELAFKDAMLWAGPAAQYVPAEGEPANNFQKFTVEFDAAEVDLSGASYLAVQYFAKTGAPGLTYALHGGSASYSIVGNNGKKMYSVKEDGTVAAASVVTYDASAVSGLAGTLLIPMDAMSWQNSGSAADKNLEKINSLSFTTNSLFNWSYDIVIGEIGYYTGILGEADCTFTKILDLTEGAKADKFALSSDVLRDSGKISINKIDRKVYGDVKLDWFATNKTSSSFAIWDGGSMGEAVMTTDSYGDDAVKLKATGVNPTGDTYTATTIADGIRYEWQGQKGITFWARNDSDTEVSFNVEMDANNTVPAQEEGKTKKITGRFNVKQGYRFWLYDVNTGKQTIYMTRPCATLPVGFEGWVRIPFDAFFQADWSLDAHGAFPRDKFMTEGSFVSYLAITVHAPSYKDKAFSVNKFGSYTQTPHFVSELIKPGDSAMSIPMLMGF